MVLVAAKWGLFRARPGPARAAPDDKIAEIIVRASREAYAQQGMACVCPNDLALGGGRCGAQSIYSRAQGVGPRCSVSDVTPDDIMQYKTRTTGVTSPP